MIGSDNINSIDLTQATLVLTERIVLLVEQTRSKVSAYLNSETTLMNWQIGQYIHLELKQKGKNPIARICNPCPQIKAAYSHERNKFYNDRNYSL